MKDQTSFIISDDFSIQLIQFEQEYYHYFYLATQTTTSTTQTTTSTTQTTTSTSETTTSTSETTSSVTQTATSTTQTTTTGKLIHET